MRGRSEEDKLKYAEMLSWGEDVVLDHIDQMQAREDLAAAAGLDVSAPRDDLADCNAALGFNLLNDERTHMAHDPELLLKSTPSPPAQPLQQSTPPAPSGNTKQAEHRDLGATAAEERINRFARPDPGSGSSGVTEGWQASGATLSHPVDHPAANATIALLCGPP